MRKLIDTPQKDGMDTEYACGLIVSGSWASRLKKHEEFLESEMGKYISNLEENIPIERVERYARMQHYLGTQDREFVEFNDWKSL